MCSRPHRDRLGPEPRNEMSWAMRRKGLALAFLLHLSLSMIVTFIFGFKDLRPASTSLCSQESLRFLLLLSVI